jgi:hypothetical protein
MSQSKHTQRSSRRLREDNERSVAVGMLRELLKLVVLTTFVVYATIRLVLGGDPAAIALLLAWACT